MADGGRTVVFFPEGAYGPTNNCVGIGEILRRRGHRVVFVIEESFEGALAAKGFEERLMRLQPKPEVEEEPGQFWKDYIRETAPEFRKPTIEQLETVIAPIWSELLDGARFVEERLSEILDEVQPDVVVEDNVLTFPALLRSPAPWVRIVSCNPLELKDPKLPPPYSGLPADDPTEWVGFRAEYERATATLWNDFDIFCQEHGCPPLPAGAFIHSADLNIYTYPEDVDYPRSQPLGPDWHRIEASVRDTDAPFTVPEEVAGDGPLLYLSLGSLGSADTALMTRLIDILASGGHRCIVSKGPQHTEYDLSDRMWGEEFLPQVSVLPHTDLVITHGGNNTTLESFYFGKPMIVLPLFWDQYDNAQRVDETGFGLRLPPYTLEADQLLAGIERLLADRPLAERLSRISARLQANPGTTRVADLIEGLARDRSPVR
jgi:MGT family glycosyltransferase